MADSDVEDDSADRREDDRLDQEAEILLRPAPGPQDVDRDRGRPAPGRPGSSSTGRRPARRATTGSGPGRSSRASIPGRGAGGSCARPARPTIARTAIGRAGEPSPPDPARRARRAGRHRAGPSAAGSHRRPQGRRRCAGPGAFGMPDPASGGDARRRRLSEARPGGRARLEGRVLGRASGAASGWRRAGRRRGRRRRRRARRRRRGRAIAQDRRRRARRPGPRSASPRRRRRGGPAPRLPGWTTTRSRRSGRRTAPRTGCCPVQQVGGKVAGSPSTWQTALLRPAERDRLVFEPGLGQDLLAGQARSAERDAAGRPSSRRRARRRGRRDGCRSPRRTSPPAATRRGP